MNKKKARVIGTTDNAISKTESALGFKFPATFREWLIRKNGTNIDDITIFPVFDERDPRKTWDSIVRNYNENWRSWLNNFGPARDFSNLLPFGEFGTGDYFCFDFSSVALRGEPSIVIWFHETGKTQPTAGNFNQFVEMAESGELDY